MGSHSFLRVHWWN